MCSQPLLTSHYRCHAMQAGELVQLFGLSTDATPKQGRLQEQMAVLAQRCVGGESDTKVI